MTLTATERGWGDPGAPGSAQAKAYFSANIVSTKIAGVTWLVHHKFEPILRALLLRHVVPTIGDIAVHADDWSYANRCIRGTGPGTSKPCVKSNHSWGLAVDVNATQNVQGTSDHHGQFPAGFGAEVSYLMVRWGGDYTSRTDPMHFEFMGTPDDADRIAAIIEGDEDMPLTDADVTAVANAVNGRVDAQLKQTEKIMQDYHRATAAVLAEHTAALTALQNATTGGAAVDYYVLADKVVERLATRLANG